MKHRYDLATRDWTLAGYTPYQWQFDVSMELGLPPAADVPTIPASIPGSVQGALRAAGHLPDWNVELNARACEWVEQRHWIYETTIPTEWIADGVECRLECDGLDYGGWVLWDGRETATFENTFLPVVVPLPVEPAQPAHRLHLVFDCPPRWLGQFGYTSRITAWKPRFNYTWDWTSRLVQIGVWDAMTLVVSNGEELRDIAVTMDADVPTGTGIVTLRGHIQGRQGTQVRVQLLDAGAVIWSTNVSPATFTAGITWHDLPVSLWWPNGMGTQPLYDLVIELCDANGQILDIPHWASWADSTSARSQAPERMLTPSWRSRRKWCTAVDTFPVSTT